MTRFITFLTVVFATIALAACGSGSSDSTGGSNTGPITLGFAIGETGFMEANDVPARDFAEFAINKINAQGGVDGRKFQTVSQNTKSNADLSGDAATQVLDNGADIVVTSCDFDQGAPAALVAQKQGTLAYSTCAGSTAFGPQGIGPLAFTGAHAAPGEGATMAEFAYDKLKARTAYSLLDDSIDYEKQTEYGFTTRWKQLGGQLLGSDTFKQTDPSIASQISNIKNLPNPPDVIWLSSYMPAEASVFKQIRNAGIDAPILTDQNPDGDYWKGAVPGLSDLYYPAYGSLYGDDPDPKVNDLMKQYQQQIGKRPDTASGLTGYAMVQILADAIKGAKGSTDGSALQKQLETIRDTNLIVPTQFSSNFHITLKRALRIMQVQNGKTTYLELHTPSQVPLPATK